MGFMALDEAMFTLMEVLGLRLVVVIPCVFGLRLLIAVPLVFVVLLAELDLLVVHWRHFL